MRHAFGLIGAPLSLPSFGISSTCLLSQHLCKESTSQWFSVLSDVVVSTMIKTNDLGVPLIKSGLRTYVRHLRSICVGISVARALFGTTVPENCFCGGLSLFHIYPCCSLPMASKLLTGILHTRTAPSGGIGLPHLRSFKSIELCV